MAVRASLCNNILTLDLLQFLLPVFVVLDIAVELRVQMFIVSYGHSTSHLTAHCAVNHSLLFKRQLTDVTYVSFLSPHILCQQHKITIVFIVPTCL